MPERLWAPDSELSAAVQSTRRYTNQRVIYEPIPNLGLQICNRHSLGGTISIPEKKKDHNTLACSSVLLSQCFGVTIIWAVGVGETFLGKACVTRRKRESWRPLYSLTEQLAGVSAQSCLKFSSSQFSNDCYFRGNLSGKVRTEKQFIFSLVFFCLLIS